MRVFPHVTDGLMLLISCVYLPFLAFLPSAQVDTAFQDTIPS